VEGLCNNNGRLTLAGDAEQDAVAADGTYYFPVNYALGEGMVSYGFLGFISGFHSEACVGNLQAGT